MRSNPNDLVQVALAVTAVFILIVVSSRLMNRYRWRALRLRLLTGTGPQRAALRVALAPVLHEFLPLLERAGQEVRAIVVAPTLSGSDGEPLAAEVEQLAGSSAFIVRLAHRVGSTKYGGRGSQRVVEKAYWPKWAGHPAAECGAKRSRGDHSAVQSKSPRPKERSELVSPDHHHRLDC